MARKSKHDSVLGVFVTDTVVDAVLMRRSGEKIHIVNRFGRPRSRLGDRISDLTTVLPGLKDSSEADFTLEVGDGTSASDPSGLFLSSEFGTMGTATMAETAEKAVTARKTTPITAQMKDILAECANMGYTSPRVAFCLGSSDIQYLELKLSTVEQSGPLERLPMFKRKNLIAQALGQGAGIFDRKRAGFIDMETRNSQQRALAVLPRTPDSLTPTLNELNSSRSQISAMAEIVDSEVTLYLSLARRQAGLTGRTAVIRVGAEDTLLLFVRDGKLSAYERIRSLTSYDPSETICSRVLLKQDEHKFGDLEHVLVVSDDQRDNTTSVYEEYFPDAKIDWMQDILRAHRVVVPSEGEVNLKGTSIPAVGVGLRWMEAWDRQEGWDGINLMPKRLVRRKKPAGRIAWHTWASMVAIFGVAFYYSWAFMSQQQEIEQQQRELELNPPVFPEEDPVALKMKVDSLNAAYVSYTNALHVLDSLLVGSDRWTRSLASMTESTGSIGGIWLRSWTPSAGNQVSLQGNALSRSRIARLAQQWNGSIEMLNFADIQKVRVYAFTMSIPVPSEIPPVALRLRETALDQEASTPVTVP